MGKADRLDKVFSALASKTRRAVVNSLAYNPATVSALANEFELSLPGMNKHLVILEEADLIRRQKVGRTNFVALNPDSLQIAQTWVAKYQTHWGSRRETLENYISKFNSTTSDMSSSKSRAIVK